MTATTTTLDDRARILAALDAFTRQRPGLEYGNYASDWRDIEGRRAYFREMRSITRDLHDFRALLAAVSWRSSITADDLRAGFRAYSGRLTLHEESSAGGSQSPRAWLEYCTGQYFPTEYRKAACAVLGSVLFYYFRSCLEEGGKLDGANDGGKIRAYARRELGRRLQARWVD